MPGRVQVNSTWTRSADGIELPRERAINPPTEPLRHPEFASLCNDLVLRKGVNPIYLVVRE